MARKPNYNFERMQRERAKSAKRAARLAAKKERAERKKAGLPVDPAPSDDPAPAPSVAPAPAPSDDAVDPAPPTE